MTPREIQAKVLWDEIWRVSKERGGAPKGWIHSWLMLKFGIGHDDPN
jgi:hypothetical protein